VNLAHVHLLLNHFPTIGTIIGVGLFLVALIARSNDLKRASYVVFLGIALITLPTYTSGNAAQEMICKAGPRPSYHAHEFNAGLVRALDTEDAERRWLVGEDIFSDIRRDRADPFSQRQAQQLYEQAWGGIRATVQERVALGPFGPGLAFKA